MDGGKSLSETALSDYIKMNRNSNKKGKAGARGGKAGGKAGGKSLKPTKRDGAKPKNASNSKPKAQAAPQKPKTKLEIKNCHVDLSNKEIYDIFAKFGTLTKCKLLTDDIGRSKGVAIVEYENGEHAKKAIEEYNDKEVKGSKLDVKFAVKKANPDADKKKKIVKEKNRPHAQNKGLRRRADSRDSRDSRDDRRSSGKTGRRDRSNSDTDRRSRGRNNRNDDNRQGGRNTRGRKNSNENGRKKFNRRY